MQVEYNQLNCVRICCSLLQYVKTERERARARERERERERDYVTAQFIIKDLPQNKHIHWNICRKDTIYNLTTFKMNKQILK